MPLQSMYSCKHIIDKIFSLYSLTKVHTMYICDIQTNKLQKTIRGYRLNNSFQYIHIKMFDSTLHCRKFFKNKGNNSIHKQRPNDFLFSFCTQFEDYVTT